MSNIYDLYIKYHNEFIEKYGKKTMILMQVGSFYEAYGTETEGPDLSEMSKILNIVCTRKDKSDNKISKKNPYMLGFPIISSAKFINMLIDNGITIVMIDQVSPPPKPERKITNIYSPGTYIVGQNKPDTNYIVCIYIEEEEQKNSKNLLCIGMTAIDLTIGKVIINEIYSSNVDDKISLDETVRFINNMVPKELIIYYKKAANTSISDDYIKSYLELDNKNYHFKTDIDKKYTKINYQVEFLKKIYNTGQINPIEFLDMERYNYALVSLIMVLDFSYNHNEKIIQNIEKPEIFIDSKYMNLGNNALQQLNIFSSDMYQSNEKIKCLFDVVNKTSTAMGRRYLQNRLTYPITNIGELNKDYDMIDKIKELIPKIEPQLKEITDLERLERKISLNLIQPYEYYEFIYGLEKVLNVHNILQKKNIKGTTNIDIDVKSYNTFKKLIDATFNIEEMKKQVFSENMGNFFLDSHSAELTQIANKLKIADNFMEIICDKLSELINDTKRDVSKKESKISLKRNDRDGHYMTITKIRYNMLKRELEKVKSLDINGIEIDKNKLIFKEHNTLYKITCPELDNKSYEIDKIKTELNTKVKNEFTKHITNIYNDYKDTFRELISYVTYFDFIKSNAKTALDYNYCRPLIKASNESYIDCENLRHPIIERIIDTEYIPHDFNLGTNTLKGMIIYGINSAGKSSLMKSTGISVIMAQSGMFVPATRFEYSPYTALYTRITGNDNIFKGLSSFALEMVELKAILSRSNKNTLVIGDEICRGTEHISGNAIVASTIINLAKLDASFIFASHLHELAQMNKITELKNVKSYHLSISYDKNKDTIIYDRKLKEGSGDNIYGITVARHIIHDSSFIDLAIEIKNELLNIRDSMISGKTSRYNSDVMIYQCQICGEHDKTGHVSNLETHHINFQKNCENGFVKGKTHIKKNQKCNLVVLCNKCHDKIHNDNIEIKEKKMTSEGSQIII